MRLEGMTGLRFSPGVPEASDVDLRSRVVRIAGEGTTRAGPAHRGHDRSDPRFQALSGGKRQHGHGGSRATTRSCYLRRRSNSPALQAKGTFYMHKIKLNRHQAKARGYAAAMSGQAAMRHNPEPAA